jgi:hypothetical protein
MDIKFSRDYQSSDIKIMVNNTKEESKFNVNDMDYLVIVTAVSYFPRINT